MITSIVTALAISFVVADVALLAAWRPWRRYAPVAGGYWGGAIALGASYAVGHVWLHSRWPPFPPAERKDWLVYLALAATGLGLLDSLLMRPAWSRWGKRAILAGAAVWLLLRTKFANPEDAWAQHPLEGAACLACLAAAMLALWGNLEALAERLPGATMPLVLLQVAVGTAGILGLYHSLSLAQLAGAVAAALGASVLVAWWNPALSLARGAVPVVTTLLSGLWIVGYVGLDEPPPACFALLAAAPAAAWIGEWRVVWERAPWLATLVRAAAVAVPVSAAVALAYHGAPATEGY